MVFHITSDLNLLFKPTLCHRVRLYISIIVLAGPNEASLRFHGLGHHVINETVLIPDALGLKLSTILSEAHKKVDNTVLAHVCYKDVCISCLYMCCPYFS